MEPTLKPELCDGEFGVAVLAIRLDLVGQRRRFPRALLENGTIQLRPVLAALRE